MRRFLLGRAIVAAVLLARPVHADEITIQPGPVEGKDTQVCETWEPYTNFGDDYGLSVQYTSDHWRSFIQFDLSAIPVGVTITGADIELHSHLSAHGDGSATVSVYQVDAAWDEHTMHWHNQPVYSTLIDAEVCAADSVWLSWDVTGLVCDWYEGNEVNYGFAVAVPDYDADQVSFWSPTTTLVSLVMAQVWSPDWSLGMPSPSPPPSFFYCWVLGVSSPVVGDGGGSVSLPQL